MKNLKKFSIASLLISSLFIGCTAEKTSLLKPEIIKEKQVSLESNQTTEKANDLLISIILKKVIEEEKEENKGSDENEKTVNSALILQALNFDESSWIPFDKKDEVLETAKEFLGVKYIWAANGPSAFDCSGFTKYVFKQNGIYLPRYSGHQANIGEKIAFENLEKGDLVFFDTAKKSRNKVNHVGIFIGNNKFIHASSGGKKVMITSFSKKTFYKDTFLYARRIIEMNESFASNSNLDEKHSFN